MAERSALRFAGAKFLPLPPPSLAKLADAAGRDLELFRGVLVRVASSKVGDHHPISAGQGLHERRPVDAEGDLVGDRGQGVVGQVLLDGVEPVLSRSTC